MSTVRLKIAHLISGDKFGGAERQLLTLCQTGASLVEAELFPSLKGPLKEAATQAGVTVRSELTTLGLLGSAKRLAKILHTECFDVLHVHGYRPETLAALVLLFSSEGLTIPVVRTVHGAPETIRAPKMALYGKIGRLSSWLTRSTMVYVSEDLVRTLRATLGGRNHLIRNGATLEDVALGARPASYTEGMINLVAIGRLTPIKGLNFLIEALQHLGSLVQLHLVGEGPDEGVLKAQVQSLGLHTRVHFHGFKQNVADYMAYADALILPSLHEGIPYVLLEALYLGVPVIASRVGGIPEVIRDGKEGILTASKDPLALANAINALLSNSNLSEALRVAGKARMSDEFSAQGMATRYVQLYRQITGTVS